MSFEAIGNVTERVVEKADRLRVYQDIVWPERQYAAQLLRRYAEYLTDEQHPFKPENVAHLMTKEAARLERFSQ